MELHGASWSLKGDGLVPIGDIFRDSGGTVKQALPDQTDRTLDCVEEKMGT